MKQNSGKIILDLCGGTGAWSKPYRDAGYDVRLITLPDYDVTKAILNDNGAIFFPRQSAELSADPGGMLVDCQSVYGILAAPPCTEFSLAKGSRPRDFAGATLVVKACLEIIWHCRTYGDLKFWALENPVGFLRQFLGIPAYQFEQWQFGESRVKRTDIWGYFNIPKPLVKDKPVKAFRGHCAWGYDFGPTSCPPEYAHLNLDRAALRAITPPGFAEAFYKANK